MSLDTRKHFLSLEQGQAALMETIQWMNTMERRSKHYGKWVPQERWERDTAARPLVRRSEEDGWVMSPERRRLKVSKGAQLTCTAVGALGVKMPFTFWSEWLWQHVGREVELFFDPMEGQPITGFVADVRTHKLLGRVTCQASLGQSRDADVEMARAIRASMLSELRCIVGSGKRVAEERTPSGTAQIVHENFCRSIPDQDADREKNHRSHGAAVVPDPRQTTVAVESQSHGAGRRGAGEALRGVSGSMDMAGRDAPAVGLRSLGRRAAKRKANF